MNEFKKIVFRDTTADGTASLDHHRCSGCFVKEKRMEFLYKQRFTMIKREKPNVKKKLIGSRIIFSYLRYSL